VHAAAAGGHGHWGLPQAGRGDVLGMDGAARVAASPLQLCNTTPFHFKFRLPFSSPPVPNYSHFFTISLEISAPGLVFKYSDGLNLNSRSQYRVLLPWKREISEI
jgi:hypothetical protein